MSANLAVVVDLGGTAIKSALCDRRGKLANRRERPTPRTAPAREILAAIAGEIAAHLSWISNSVGSRPAPLVVSPSNHERSSFDPRACRGVRMSGKVAGIGLGTPGLADPRGRIVGGCPNIPHWPGTDAGGRLRKRFRLPVAVGNDANLAALGEWKFGAAKGAKSCVLLTLGTGIGGGIVLDGKLFTGGHGLGTELGHFTVDRDGPPCKCGGRGCLERYASATAIIEKYNKTGIRSQESGVKNVREVFQRARKGDRRAKRVIGEALETLGLAAAGFINVFNPEVFILGGGMSRIPGVTAAVARAARKHAIDICQKNVRIVPAKLGNDAGLAGAAATVFSA